jgi:hypothetical protein
MIHEFYNEAAGKKIQRRSRDRLRLCGKLRPVQSPSARHFPGTFGAVTL